MLSDNKNVKKSQSKINLVRLSDFVHDYVAQRSLSFYNATSLPPTVLMKMDIEGSEIEVLTDLLLTGSFLTIDNTIIEFHDWLANTEERKAQSKSLREALGAMEKISQKFKLVEVDDESYLNASPELPKC